MEGNGVKEMVSDVVINCIGGIEFRDFGRGRQGHENRKIGKPPRCCSSKTSLRSTLEEAAWSSLISDEQDQLTRG